MKNHWIPAIILVVYGAMIVATALTMRPAHQMSQFAIPSSPDETWDKTSTVLNGPYQQAWRAVYQRSSADFIYLLDTLPGNSPELLSQGFAIENYIQILGARNFNLFDVERTELLAAFLQRLEVGANPYGCGDDDSLYNASLQAHTHHAARLIGTVQSRELEILFDAWDRPVAFTTTVAHERAHFARLNLQSALINWGFSSTEISTLINSNISNEHYCPVLERFIETLLNETTQLSKDLRFFVVQQLYSTGNPI